MVFPNGEVLEDPTNAEIALGRRGSPISPERMDFDVVVVGAGPAGLSAAVYGASEGLEHAGGRPGRHRGPGHVELADPQLPRLPTRGQRPAARAERRLRPGLGVRAGFAFMQHGRRGRPARATSSWSRCRTGCALRTGVVLLSTGARLPPNRRPVARGAQRGPASSTAARPRRHRRWPTATCSWSAARTRRARRSCTWPGTPGTVTLVIRGGVAARRDVGLPGEPGRGHRQHRGAPRHGGGRRRRRRPPRAPGAARPRVR